MSFSITFTGEKKDNDYREKVAIGELMLFDCLEKFESSMTYWNEHHYMTQWREGLKRLFNNHNTSCLITSMYDPKYAKFIFRWLIYLEKDVAHFQEQLFFIKDKDRFVDINDLLYSSISKRSVCDENGNEVSEWDVPIKEVRKFYENLNQQE